MAMAPGVAKFGGKILRLDPLYRNVVTSCVGRSRAADVGVEARGRRPARSVPGVVALSLTLALLALVRPVAAQTLADTVEKIRPAVVAVGTAYPRRQPIGRKRPNAVLGSGFAVGDGTLIVTNDHVIPEKLDLDNQQTLAVFVGRGKQARVRPATVHRRDPERDLALLRIGGKALPALALGDDSAIREGDDIAFTGYPIGAVLGLFPATHRGIVAAITPLARAADSSRDLGATQMSRLRNPVDVFQLDAIAYPGNSGSPVYLPGSGEVIGVINSVFVKESRESLLQRPSGISYAIPVRHLRALLEDAQGRP